MYEVELKATIKNDLLLFQKLEALGASKFEEVLYQDTYYDTPQKEFLQAERELRVRKIIGESNKVLLTYKDSPFDLTSKSKAEYEVEVDSCTIKEILSMLGYIIEIEFTKKCKNSYIQFNNQRILVTIVEIQELKSKFIEIETIVENIINFKDVMNNLKLLFKFLKIEDIDITNKYYRDLIKEVRSV